MVASIRLTVSSRRSWVELSRKDRVATGKIGRPSSCMLTKGASPAVGKPRTSIFGPETPPVVSAKRPGTSLTRSAALVGAAFKIACSLAVVMA